MTIIFAATADVRELARSVLTADFLNNEIIKEQEAAAAYIITKTKKSDWDTDDLEFPLIKKLEIKLAAKYVLEHYDTSQYLTTLESWANEINNGLQAIIDNSDEVDVDEPDLEIARTEFKTYPKNPDATISRGRLSFATSEVDED